MRKNTLLLLIHVHYVLVHLFSRLKNVVKKDIYSIKNSSGIKTDQVFSHELYSGFLPSPYIIEDQLLQIALRYELFL